MTSKMKRIHTDLEDSVKGIQRLATLNGMEIDGRDPSFVKSCSIAASILREQEDKMRNDIELLAKHLRQFA